MAEGRDTEFTTGPGEGGTENGKGVPRVGDVIAGKYRVERVLGVGGMGVVVAVTHLQLGEPYAIKFLLPGGQRDPEVVARFLREARAAVRIKSEHIARVNDVGQLPDGAPFILMEYLVGRDLSDVIRERGPLPVGEALEYLLQACAGVAEAHALGIVHRDLKPSNLFLTPRSDGTPLIKILDFGIAKAMHAGPENTSLTQTSSAFGSPAYMSPEQVRSTKKVDFRTDVWALGVILFELLTGELPFTADNAPGLLAAIVADPPESVLVRRPDVGPEIDAIIRRCLEKDPNRRVQSVSDLAEAIAPFARGSSVSVGRIRRLSQPVSGSIPPSYPLSPPLPRSAGIMAAAVTEKPWSTRARRSRNGRTMLIASAGAALVLASVVGYVARVGRPSPATTAAARSSMIPEAPSVASPTAASTQESEPSITGSATVSAAKSAAPPLRRTPRGPSGSASVSAAPPIPPPVAPAAPPPHARDPLSESH